MRAALEGLELGHRRGVLVLLPLRLVDLLGDHVVLAAGDEEQRRAIVVAVVDLARRPRVEVGQRALEEHAAGAGHGVPLPDRLRLLRAHRVGEGVVELLGREQHRAVVVERALEDREGRLELGGREREDALGGGRVDRHAGDAVAAVEQQLGEEAAEGVAHDDRLAVEALDDVLIRLDDLVDADMLGPGGVGAQFLRRAVEAGPRRSEHLVAGGLVAGDPVLPAERVHPQAVDEHDGGRFRHGPDAMTGPRNPLQRVDLTCVAQRVRKLSAIADPELRKRPVQVGGDGAGGEEEPLSDLGVREAAGRELGDLQLLRRELIKGPRHAPDARLAAGPQLLPGTLGPRDGAESVEEVARGP